jgi:hypothetical protein
MRDIQLHNKVINSRIRSIRDTAAQISSRALFLVMGLVDGEATALVRRERDERNNDHINERRREGESTGKPKRLCATADDEERQWKKIREQSKKNAYSP